MEFPREEAKDNTPEEALTPEDFQLNAETWRMPPAKEMRAPLPADAPAPGTAIPLRMRARRLKAETEAADGSTESLSGI